MLRAVPAPARSLDRALPRAGMIAGVVFETLALAGTLALATTFSLLHPSRADAAPPQEAS